MPTGAVHVSQLKLLSQELKNLIANVFQEYPENFAFQLFAILELFCNLLISLKVVSSIALSFAFFVWSKALHSNTSQTMVF